MNHPIIERLFPIDSQAIEPVVTAETAPYWSALQEGRFVGQACTVCAAVQIPGGPNCQCCGSRALSWIELAGEGTVFSWVRFRRPYLPEFEDLIPYCVATVQLAEGARLYARMLGPSEPLIGQRVKLVIERWPSGVCVPVFETMADEGSSLPQSGRYASLEREPKIADIM